jgi:predicted O-methyltransferase YrrM
MIFAREIGSAVSDTECKKLDELGEDKVCLEVGSWYGRSTVTLASAATLVHSIDWHRGEAASERDKKDRIFSLPILHGNLERYGLLEKVVLHVGTSTQVCPYLASQRFGFAFIDADHTYEGVKEDIVQVLPLLRPGAKIMFHDYTWGEELGVMQAVDEFFPSVEVCGSSAIVET